MALSARHCSSLRPKRRAHRDPFSEKKFPPVKKMSSSRFEIYLSEKCSFCSEIILDYLTFSKFPSSCKMLLVFSLTPNGTLVPKIEASRNKEVNFKTIFHKIHSRK